jgi:hypothetical protein
VPLRGRGSSSPGPERRTESRPASLQRVRPERGSPPRGEKELYKAVKSQDAAAIKRVGEQHPDFRLGSYSIAGLMMLPTAPSEAERLLDEAFATGEDPADDKFISSYMYTRLELPIAEGVTADCQTRHGS